MSTSDLSGRTCLRAEKFCGEMVIAEYRPMAVTGKTTLISKQTHKQSKKIAQCEAF